MNWRSTRVMLGLAALLTVGCAGAETKSDVFLTGEVESLGEESQSGRLNLRGMLNPADGAPYQVYELTLDADDVIRLVAESGEFEPRLALYNEEGELLGTTTRDEYSPRNRQQLIRRVTEDGAYLVVVSSASHRDFGAYEIKAEAIEEAGEFTFPGEAEGYLYEGRGVHPSTGAPYRSFPLEIEEATMVELQMRSSDFAPFISVVSEGTDTVLAERYSDDGQQARLVMELEAGSYEIWASAGSAGVDGKFRLSGQVADFQRSEGFEIGATYRGFLSLDRETIPGSRRSGDALHFELEEEAVLTAVLRSQDFDGYMVLTDANGMVLTEDDDSAGNLDPQIIWPLDPGSYTLWATSFSEGESGVYQVETSLSDDDLSEASIEGPIELGESAQGQLTQADGRYRQRNSFIKYYTLEITEETEVKVELRSGEFDTYLVLEDERGRMITENDDGVMGTTDSEITHRLEPGTYRIGVTSYASGETGSFELVVDQAVSGQRV